MEWGRVEGVYSVEGVGWSGGIVSMIIESVDSIKATGHII